MLVRSLALAKRSFRSSRSKQNYKGYFRLGRTRSTTVHATSNGSGMCKVPHRVWYQLRTYPRVIDIETEKEWKETRKAKTEEKTSKLGIKKRTHGSFRSRPGPVVVLERILEKLGLFSVRRAVGRALRMGDSHARRTDTCASAGTGGRWGLRPHEGYRPFRQQTKLTCEGDVWVEYDK